MFRPDLKTGELINNRRLMDIFHCACEGGIRYSSKTGTVVLVINNTKTGLPNTVEGSEISFAGRILKNGYSGANKRLKEFLEQKQPVFLFVVNRPGEYEFLGQVQLAGAIELRKTEKGEAYPVFPLKLNI